MTQPTQQTYGSLRSAVLHNETKTEITLAEYSSVTSSPPSERDIELEDKLRTIFDQRREILDAMSQIIDGTDPSSGSAARVHQVARAREILVEHEREFRRMKVW
jgi:hypothetical protein